MADASPSTTKHSAIIDTHIHSGGLRILLVANITCNSGDLTDVTRNVRIVFATHFAGLRMPSRRLVSLLTLFMAAVLISNRYLRLYHSPVLWLFAVVLSLYSNAIMLIQNYPFCQRRGMSTFICGR